MRKNKKKNLLRRRSFDNRYKKTYLAPSAGQGWPSVPVAKDGRRELPESIQLKVYTF